eukprot:TRINITY_DN65346_c0_g1_i1.p1 TRINITY_DN65346_c0_g1~~TRINITY_DN65346_c0_g1_i1.p1  ORF type:complete len:189 (+),score=25.10 TRINITY_DN65346_c0_g1_i1:80-568(+)
MAFAALASAVLFGFAPLHTETAFIAGAGQDQAVHASDALAGGNASRNPYEDVRHGCDNGCQAAECTRCDPSCSSAVHEVVANAFVCRCNDCTRWQPRSWEYGCNNGCTRTSGCSSCPNECQIDEVKDREGQLFCVCSGCEAKTERAVLDKITAEEADMMASS